MRGREHLEAHYALPRICRKLKGILPNHSLAADFVMQLGALLPAPAHNEWQLSGPPRATGTLCCRADRYVSMGQSGKDLMPHTASERVRCRCCRENEYTSWQAGSGLHTQGRYRSAYNAQDSQRRAGCRYQTVHLETQMVSAFGKSICNAQCSDEGKLGRTCTHPAPMPMLCQSSEGKG